MRWLTWFPWQRCIAACANVCVLLEVSMGDGSSGSFPLVPSLSLYQVTGPSGSPWPRNERENGISPSLARATFWLNQKNLRFLPGLIACGSPPRPFAAVMLLGEKYLGCMWAPSL